MAYIIHTFLNLKILVVFNLAIIAAVFLLGSFLVDSGYIHLISLIFVFLALYVIFTRYNFSNRFLRVFSYLNLLNLFFLSISHVWEFITHRFLGVSEVAVESVVLSFYFISFLVVFFILRYISDVYEGKLDFDARMFLIPFAAVVPFVYFFLQFSDSIIMPAGVAIFVLTVFIGAFLCVKVLRKGKTIPILRDFMRYLLVFIVFIIVSSLFEFLEIFEFSSGTVQLLIEYLAHFGIYLALSAYILGLIKLLSAGDFSKL